MGYRGLDFGSGISHYADLMAQGYKDRQDLQMRQDALMRQQQQDELHNHIAKYQANKLYGAFEDEFGQPGGLAGVQEFIEPGGMPGAGSPADIAQANGAPSNAVSQLRNPASPYPNDPIMAPPQAPALAPEPRMVSPYQNEILRDAYLKKIGGEAAMARALLSNQGRADTGSANRDVEYKRLAIQALSTQLATEKAQRGKYDEFTHPEKVKASDERIQSITDQLSQLAGVSAKTQTSAPSTSKAAPKKTVVKKFHNQKENKTRLIYSDKTEEIVDGIQ